MKTIQDYVIAYGTEAGPRLFHALKSRAAFKGVSTRRRRRIERLTGQVYRVRRPVARPLVQPSLPLADPEAVVAG